MFLNLANPVFRNAKFSRKFASGVVVVIFARFLFQVNFGSTWIQEVVILNCLILIGIFIVLWVFKSKNGEFSYVKDGVSS